MRMPAENEKIELLFLREGKVVGPRPDRMEDWTCAGSRCGHRTGGCYAGVIDRRGWSGNERRRQTMARKPPVV